jgi:hypothetical protein
MVPFSFRPFLPGGRRFGEQYPRHIQAWSGRLKASIAKDDMADLKEKYKSVPLRRPTKPTPKKAKKKR